jgi:hypothetical protein
MRESLYKGVFGMIFWLVPRVCFPLYGLSLQGTALSISNKIARSFKWLIERELTDEAYFITE